MSQEEMLEAITILRSERDELRKEAIARKRERDAGANVKEPAKPKVAKVVDPFMDNMIGFLKGDNV